jgi:Ca2+-binding EF-hand superfamily protein
MLVQIFRVLGLSVLAAGAAVAQTDRPVDRFFATFDLNHDGKVTKDELNKAETARFSAAAHGGAMSAEQFAAADMAQFRRHTDQAFRRLDWSGDGKLSLDEYAAPLRVRFAAFDTDGKNAESCTDVQNAAYKPGRGGGLGRSRFCAENDLNRDGSVTHAEFDAATAKRFAALSANGRAISAAQFSADALTRWKAVGARMFRRLDTDRNGVLSPAEFAASDLKFFAALDKNKDGVVTRDELGRGVPQKRT